MTTVSRSSQGGRALLIGRKRIFCDGTSAVTELAQYRTLHRRPGASDHSCWQASTEGKHAAGGQSLESGCQHNLSAYHVGRMTESQWPDDNRDTSDGGGEAAQKRLWQSAPGMLEGYGRM